MKVTHGSVEFTRRLNTGDYSHKDAKVILSFEIKEGEDVAKAAAYVGQIATIQAAVMVGERPADEPVQVEEPKPARTRKAKEAPAVDPLAGAPAEATISAPATPAVAAVDPLSATPTLATGTAGSIDPLASGQPSGVATGGSPSPAIVGQAAGAIDPLASVSNVVAITEPTTVAGPAPTASAESTPVIANAELQNVMMENMKRLVPLYGTDVASAKFGEVIRSYGAMDILQIPVDKRAEFVERVKAVA